MKRREREAAQPRTTKKPLRKSKVVRTRNSFVQTECIMGCKLAIVCIDKLNTEPSVRQSTENSNDHLTVLHPSMVQNTQKTISRAPYSYKIFARTITNKETANSTLADTSVNDNVAAFKTTFTTNPANHTFIKPGPMCYKQKVLRQKESCGLSFAIPVMREEYSENIEPLRASEVNLDAILEQTEPPSTPEPQLNLNLDDYRDLVIQQEDVATQCSNNTIEFVQVDGLNLNNVRSPKRRVQTDEQPGCSNASATANAGHNVKTVRFDCNGATTLITSRSTANSTGYEDNSRNKNKKNRGGSSSSSSDSDSDAKGGYSGESKRRKYVRIKANAVYIHNHFYKNP